MVNRCPGGTRHNTWLPSGMRSKSCWGRAARSAWMLVGAQSLACARGQRAAPLTVQVALEVAPTADDEVPASHAVHRAAPAADQVPAWQTCRGSGGWQAPVIAYPCSYKRLAGCPQSKTCTTHHAR